MVNRHLHCHSITVALIGAAWLLALAGCGDSTTGMVSGTVLVDGQPAQTGAVSYIPLSGATTTAGCVITDGEYTAAVPVGEFRVEVRVPKIVGKKKIYDTPDSPIQDVMQESLPAKFNDESELTYTVNAGKSTKDYSFSTK